MPAVVVDSAVSPARRRAPHARPGRVLGPRPDARTARSASSPTTTCATVCSPWASTSVPRSATSRPRPRARSTPARRPTTPCSRCCPTASGTCPWSTARRHGGRRRRGRRPARRAEPYSGPACAAQCHARPRRPGSSRWPRRSDPRCSVRSPRVTRPRPSAPRCRRSSSRWWPRLSSCTCASGASRPGPSSGWSPARSPDARRCSRSDLDSLMAWEGADDDPETKGWMRRSRLRRARDAPRVRAQPRRQRRPRRRPALLPLGRRLARRRRAPGPPTPQPHRPTSTCHPRPTRCPSWGHGSWAPVADAVAAAHARPAVRRPAPGGHGLRPPTGFVRDLVIDRLRRARRHARPQARRSRPRRAIAATWPLVPTAPAATIDRGCGRRPSRALRRRRGRARPARRVRRGAGRPGSITRLAQSRRGEAPDDHLRPDELDDPARRGLRDAFRVVARVQRGLPPPVAAP